MINISSKLLNGLESSFVHLKYLPKMPFYAVAKGRTTGVFNTWDECEKQVKGFPGPKFKKFGTVKEAWSFVNGSSHSSTMSSALSVPATSTSPMTRNRSAASIATHVQTPDPRPKKAKVKHEPNDDESVVIANVNAQLDTSFNHVPDSKTVKVHDMDQIHVESVRISHDPDDIFEPRKVFVVIEGKNKGIYNSMADAWKEIDGFPHSFVKSFNDEDDAKFFLDTYRPAQVTNRQNGQSVMDKHVNVWTDGACEGNGRNGAVAGIGVFWGPNDPRNVSEPLLGRQTNNRAEIYAAIRAIRAAKEQGYTSISVHTDSMFLINSITKWVSGWIKNGWILSSGGVVINKEDFIELLDAMKGINVEWVKVVGHSGDIGNDEADRLAKEGINKPLVTASSWKSPRLQRYEAN